MFSKIKRDEEEFLEIVKGRIRKDLKKHLTHGNIVLPKKGEGKNVSIPVPEIDIPTFRFGKAGGVGQGKGEPGTDLGPIKGKPQKGEGEKQAGTGSTEDLIEVEIPVHEFAKWFQEVLELPDIQPKGQKNLEAEEKKYSEIRKAGPESLLHKKRTYKAALKRSLAEGSYDPKNPIVIPSRDDRRYRSWKTIKKPKNNAVLIYMMDVSGSMRAEERETVRHTCALCEFWLSWNYDGLETAYIIHNGKADRVTREEFFSTRRMGGTVASTAHKVCIELMEDEFPPADWNIYPMYFSDGFNWREDNVKCMKLLKEKIVPVVNQYSYGQIEVTRDWWSQYRKSGSKKFSSPGSFGIYLMDNFANKKAIFTQIRSKGDSVRALKSFFGKKDK